jgi:hypothetical protein
VLSTLQVVPLVLLTVEAWRFRRLPESTLARSGREGGAAAFGLREAFLFLIGVNFWNFLGAGVFGFAINLPIVNYYQHGTCLTVNHGHAALFGVYGNLAIAAMLFCGRWLVVEDRWNPRLLRTAFWSLNVGLALMVVMDLFPVGVDQLLVVMESGYAHARSEAYVRGATFQAYAWLRGVGGAVFVLGDGPPRASRRPCDAHSGRPGHRGPPPLRADALHGGGDVPALDRLTGGLEVLHREPGRRPVARRRTDLVEDGREGRHDPGHVERAGEEQGEDLQLLLERGAGLRAGGGG